MYRVWTAFIGLAAPNHLLIPLFLTGTSFLIYVFFNLRQPFTEHNSGIKQWLRVTIIIIIIIVITIIPFSGYLLTYRLNNISVNYKASTKTQIKHKSGTNTQKQTLNRQNKNNIAEKSNIKEALWQKTYILNNNNNNTHLDIQGLKMVSK
jgi:hypothetical protein